MKETVQTQNEFFVVGGTMQPDSPSYIERQADRELFEHTLRGDFCYVLTSRQMGKSSLMARTNGLLRKQGVCTAIVDLTQLGSDMTIADVWYYGIAYQISRELGMKVDLNSWWQGHRNLPTLLRLTEFFSDVVLEYTDGSPVVIFVDEIDTTIVMPFTDDFFAAIRACYNTRAIKPKYNRLAFVLLGVASPTDLIKDPQRTPFNVGRRIELTDFTLPEARPLVAGLGADNEMGEQILQAILDWTGGHPYLTQKLCQLVATSNLPTCSEKEIELLVIEKFLSLQAYREDHNLREVGARLTITSQNARSVLNLYKRILHGETIFDDPLSSEHTILKLSGIVVPTDEGKLRVRNRIYESVFTVEWVRGKEQELTPKATKPISYEKVPPDAKVIRPRLTVFLELRKRLLKLLRLLSDYVESSLRIFFSRFYKRYVAKLRAQNRFFNVKGVTIQSVFSLELQKVFIDLNISSYRAAQPSAMGQPNEPPKSIWELLESNAPQHRVLAIIGKPGSGKTTMLQHVTLLIATRGARGKSKDYIPFHVPLRKFVAEIVKPATESPTLAHVLEIEAKDVEPPPIWFAQKLINHGHRCVVMLDGLDEVAEPRERKQMAAWVKQQTENYPHTRFIITSRPHGYNSNPIADATVLQIEDFSEPQIRDFVNKWYRTTEIAAAAKSDREVLSRAEENARDLLQRIFQSEILSRLALNPLLLTMITMVHRYVGKLPEMRTALYEDIIRVLSGRRETAIKGIKLSYYQKRDILQTLALAMMRERKREIATREAITIIQPDLELVNLNAEDGQIFLDTIMNETGLLVENDVGRLAFAHLTYQEFLSAAEIKNRQKEDFLIERSSDPWWHETILLYAATSDATRIVRACLDQPERSLENLKLAYEILQEAMQIAPQERKRLEGILVLEAESENREKQQLAADLIFEIRLKKMIRLTNNVDVDPFFISQLEYQNFINETGRRPDHWSGLRYSTREGLKPIVGVRYSDAEAYTQWLTVRAARELGHRTSQFRLPTREEIVLVRSDREVQDYNFRDLTSAGLGAWLLSKNEVATETSARSLEALFQMMLNAGEKEMPRIGDYHLFVDDLLEKLNQRLQELDRELHSTEDELWGTNLGTVLSALPNKVDGFLEKLNAIKGTFFALVKQAQERGFTFAVERNQISEIDFDLVELSRLRFSRAGAEVYQKTDVDRIRQHLSGTRQRLELLRGILVEPTTRSRQLQESLTRTLLAELHTVAGKPIDLEQQLAFLKNLGELRLSTKEIQAMQERRIGKNYEKARAELLTLAEYALYQNKTELLREILRGFWAVFFVEQRANRQNPLPAWEGIRLVREIRRPDEETTHI